MGSLSLPPALTHAPSVCWQCPHPLQALTPSLGPRTCAPGGPRGWQRACGSIQQGPRALPAECFTGWALGSF